MKVILNVDDYGYTKSQVDGVIYGYQNGAVTSTTCLANVRDELMEYAAAKAKENPGLGIGCHLVLTLGECLTKGKTICKPDGTFYKQDEIDYEKMDREEIYQEFKAQIERFIKYFGKKPTHLDGHHRTYGMMDTNNIKEIVFRLTKEYGLSDGRGFNDHVYYAGDLYNRFTATNFEQVIGEAYHNGIDCIEQACHVAFVDEELFTKSSYNYQRVMELKEICSQEIKDFYTKYNIEKVHY